MAALTGIERYFLEQKVARLNELKARLAAKIGPCEAASLPHWYTAAKDAGGCPNCGLDFNTSAPETNIYPHFTGECAED